MTWAACAAHDADVYVDDLPLMPERVKKLARGLEDFKGYGGFTVPVREVKLYYYFRGRAEDGIRDTTMPVVADHVVRRSSRLKLIVGRWG